MSFLQFNKQLMEDEHFEFNLPTNKLLTSLSKIDDMYKFYTFNGYRLQLTLIDGLVCIRNKEKVYSKADIKSSWPTVLSNIQLAVLDLLNTDKFLHEFLDQVDLEVEVLLNYSGTSLLNIRRVLVLENLLTNEPSLIKKIHAKANGRKFKVETGLYDTTDGLNIDFVKVPVLWLVGTPEVTTKLKPYTAGYVKSLTEFLEAKSSLDVSNYFVLNAGNKKIGEHTTDEKNLVKDLIKTKLNKMELEIINKLLDKIGYKAFDKYLEEEKATVDLQGVILLDTTTNVINELVNPDLFKEKVQSVKNRNRRLDGPPRTVNDDEPLETRGGIIGWSVARIKRLLDQQLVIPGSARPILLSLQGETVEETMKNLVDAYGEDYVFIRGKIILVCQNCLDEIEVYIQENKPTDKISLLTLAFGHEYISHMLFDIRKSYDPIALMGNLFRKELVAMHQ